MTTWGRRALALLLSGILHAFAAEGEVVQVIILANRDDPGSLQVARHYAAARGVPEENIVALSMPTTESIAWRDFVSQVWQPLIDRLVSEKWLDAIPMALTDPVGRRKFAPYGHRIAALVVCRGVPLKIAHDPALASESAPFTQRAEFRTNAGSLDAELSLLPAPNYNINAFVPNPLFQSDNAGDAARHIVRVSRLDGPTVEDAMALVDRALVAERNGLLGRAYIDLSSRDPVGNEWLESAARQLADLGFVPDIDREPATYPSTARFDAPALYFGWYASDLNGPFALPGFRFPPGAIALHIHSYSAGSLRTTTQGWTAPFVARGVTATVGNVNEPYLQLTHRPDLMLRALARGATLAEAAYFALPVLSWQAVLIGDPLYRPFARSPDTERNRRLDPASPYRGYAALQKVEELKRANQTDEARRLGEKQLQHAPNLALALRVAALCLETDDKRAAAQAIERGLASVAALRADEWALAAEAARAASKVGLSRGALELWQRILAIVALPRELRISWLPEAVTAAEAADDAAQAARWKSELAKLLAPESR